jgi:hypothetical protein
MPPARGLVQLGVLEVVEAKGQCPLGHVDVDADHVEHHVGVE